MIHSTILYIKEELKKATGVETLLGPVSAIKKRTTSEAYYQISLVNVSEEVTLKNLPHHFRDANNVLKRQKPPVYANLYLLIIPQRKDYGDILELLTKLGAFFQEKNFFEPANTTNNVEPFPSGVQRLVVELNNLSLEELNHFWGIHGTNYYPSMLYKVRVVPVQEGAKTEDLAEITKTKLVQEALAGTGQPGIGRMPSTIIPKQPHLDE